MSRTHKSLSQTNQLLCLCIISRTTLTNLYCRFFLALCSATGCSMFANRIKIIGFLSLVCFLIETKFSLTSPRRWQVMQFDTLSNMNVWIASLTYWTKSYSSLTAYAAIKRSLWFCVVRFECVFSLCRWIFRCLLFLLIEIRFLFYVRCVFFHNFNDSFVCMWLLAFGYLISV